MNNPWTSISFKQSKDFQIYAKPKGCQFNYKNQELKVNHLFDKHYEIQEVKIKYYDDIVPCEFSQKSSAEGLVLITKAMLSKVERQLFEEKYLCQIKAMEINVGFSPTQFVAGFEFNIPYFKEKTMMLYHALPSYFPSNFITEAFKKNNFQINSKQNSQGKSTELFPDIDKYFKMTREQRLGHSDQLFKMFHYALNIEDLQVEKELRRYETDNVRVKLYSDDKNMYTYHVKSKIGILLDNPRAYSVCLTPMSLFNRNNAESNARNCIIVPIIYYDDKDGLVYFERRRRINNQVNVRVDEWSQNENTTKYVLFHLKFLPNRYSIRACHNALKAISKLPVFLDFKSGLSIDGPKFPVSSFSWVNKNVASNKEQKQAIINIVNCSSLGAPYIIFGPPGTGKTSTLVEAVVQILIKKPESKILITAQSNCACDEICKRLLNFVSRNKIYRFYSPILLYQSKKKIDSNLKSISNLRSKEPEWPSSQEFYHFNIVIVTLVSSIRFNERKNKKHFDYIFIDECASSVEPESLIPIAAFGTLGGKISSQIVLLGDHKQLGPVLKSKYASDLCLGVSLLERMMHMKQYSNNDPKFVTQLLDNFRSHEAILSFSNEKFYDGKLRVKFPKKKANFALNWNLLPNKKFPILLHSSKEVCMKMMDGNSWFNEVEAKLVKSYVNKLLGKGGINGKKVDQTDIGIISPYKAQQDLLKELLQSKPQLEIGTTEYFQGREKKIIIISTVKSNASIGFLNDERRINVALTRAKCLIILICNPDTLQKVPIWQDFVRYCYDNKACTGEHFTMIIPKKEENETDQFIDKERLKQIKADLRKFLAQEID